MPKSRAKVARLRDRKTHRFGPLQLKSLFENKAWKQLSVFHIRQKAGECAPALYHRRTHEFFFVLKGSVRGKIDGKSYRFRSGDFCFLPAGSVHQFRAGRRGAVMIDVFFPRFDLDNPDIVLVEDAVPPS